MSGSNIVNLRHVLLLISKENISLPEVEDILLPPSCVFRLILVYGRSLCMPKLSPEGKQVCLCLCSAKCYVFKQKVDVYESTT